jgi:hypothetical protein
MDHSGQTYGYAEIKSMSGPWAGSHGTTYEVYRTCCKTTTELSHSEITQLRCTRSEKCIRCSRRTRGEGELSAEASSKHAVLQRQEMKGLLAQRTAEAADKQARVAARRAQAAAKLAEAHAQATGRALSGRPDFEAPLPVPVVAPVVAPVRRQRQSRRRHG